MTRHTIITNDGYNSSLQSAKFRTRTLKIQQLNHERLIFFKHVVIYYVDIDRF